MLLISAKPGAKVNSVRKLSEGVRKPRGESQGKGVKNLNDFESGFSPSIE